MSVLTVIKKIGDKIVSIVEYPFKHSVMLAKMLKDVEKDSPATYAAIIGLTQQFEALGPDALAAIASKGFDLPEDVKVIGEVKALFAYFINEVCPAIETEAADLKADLGTAPDPAPVEPQDLATVDPQALSGLAAVVPA